MKRVLLAGTINHFQDTDEVSYIHLDASPRIIYDAELNKMFQPDVVDNLADGIPTIASKSFDEVRCHHVLEHIPYGREEEAIAGIKRVLKPGGILDIEVPDIRRLATAFVVHGDLTEEDLQQWLYGEDMGGDFDVHRQGISGERLKRLLEEARFTIIEQPETGLAVRYIASRP